MNKNDRGLWQIISGRWFPWALSGAILFSALLYEVARPVFIGGTISAVRFPVWVLVWIGAIAAHWLLIRFLDLSHRRDVLENRLQEVERSLEEAYLRLEAIFQANQRFVDASDENEVVEPLLQLVVSLIGARGAAFVPLDEHGQAQASLRHGELPLPALDDWIAYLASTGVRSQCGNCENYDLVFRPPDCPLLTGPFAGAHRLLCLSVKRGEREFGVLSIFFSEGVNLDERTRTFLRALIEEMALGLDSVRLRRKELAALRQMQRLRQRTDLQALLSSLLENVQSSLEGDVALLMVPPSNRFRNKVDIIKGDLAINLRPFIDGVLQGVMASSEPVLLGEVSGNPESEPGLRSLIAAPLLSSDHNVVGAILVGNFRPRRYSQRQLALLQTIAGQVALVVQNTSLMAELEYTAMIQERTRLAREIHDGLAQTLGFLKLQVAQMRNHYARGEIENLRQNMDQIYDALSEAYLDARQSIDGLRISPEGNDLRGWLDQAIQEFEELSGLPVTSRVDVGAGLPPEVHAQLVRILQEALSNVRKHAGAQRVWVDCHEVEGDLIMEVRDDGAGFLPEDVTDSSRHGLRGMRERSDLLGADFQVISRPREGTTVRLRLPLRDVEEYLP